jgi:hypothetical protein
MRISASHDQITNKRKETRKMITTTLNRSTGKLLALVVLLVAIAASLMLAARPSYASTTFTVENTNDAGVGSLRQAMFDANVTPGADVINFDIDGTGVKTIAPRSALPIVIGPVSINGYTQPGAHPNTRAVGSDAVLKVELSGAGMPDGDGLVIEASNSTIKGLIVNRSSNSGIVIRGSGATGNRVVGNYIGTDASGTQKLGNGDSGVRIANAPNNTVGDATAAERNVISGNGSNGVIISDDNGGNATDNKVTGNYIGTDKNGATLLGNTAYGVRIANASKNTIGGTIEASRNVISGNANGVVIDTGLGGSATGNRVLRNIVSRNDGDGVKITSDVATGNRILSNSIYANADLGIDLYDDGPTANDPDDTDAGSNGLQNKPVLSSAKKSATGTTTIRGKLDSTPNKTFTVQFYSNPLGTDEGKTLLGSATASTNGSGDATFAFSTKKPIRLGQNITATATGTTGTSEFSAPRKVVAK